MSSAQGKKHMPYQFRPDVPNEALQLLTKTNSSFQQNHKMQYQKNKMMQAKQEAEEMAISRFVNMDYSSFDSGVKEEKTEIYYCSYCGEYCFIASKILDQCPLRKKDSCRVLNLQECAYKNDLNDGGIVTIKREEDILERQYRLECKTCHLPVAYRFKPDLRDCNYLYILPDSLSRDAVEFQNKIRKLHELLAETKELDDYMADLN